MSSLANTVDDESCSAPKITNARAIASAAFHKLCVSHEVDRLLAFKPLPHFDHHTPRILPLAIQFDRCTFSMHGNGRPSPPAVISRPEYFNLVARYYVETIRQVTRIKNDALAAAEMAGFGEFLLNGVERRRLKHIVSPLQQALRPIAFRYPSNSIIKFGQRWRGSGECWNMRLSIMFLRLRLLK